MCVIVVVFSFLSVLFRFIIYWIYRLFVGFCMFLFFSFVNLYSFDRFSVCMRALLLSQYIFVIYWRWPWHKYLYIYMHVCIIDVCTWFLSNFNNFYFSDALSWICFYSNRWRRHTGYIGRLYAHISYKKNVLDWRIFSVNFAEINRLMRTTLEAQNACMCLEQLFCSSFDPKLQKK